MSTDDPVADAPFDQLYKMAHGQSADRQRMSAEGWRQAARQFEALSGNLRHYRDEVAPDWHSKGGVAFREKMTDIVTTLDAYAQDIRIFAEILDDTADAVVRAQTDLNRLNNERESYIAEKEDYRDYGDGSNSNGAVDLWRDVVDVGNDTYHRVARDSHIDPARMKQYDEQARTIMRTLESAYLTANSKRPTLPEYKGPIVAVPIPNVPGAPGAPGSPPAPTPPTGIMPPVSPPPPNAPGTPPLPPTLPPVSGPGAGPGPVLVGTPVLPAPPTTNPPVTPSAPNPNLPGTPVLPVVPGLNLPGTGPGLGGSGGGALRPSLPPTPGAPGQGGRTGPGLPPSPGLNSMKKSGVIGQRPGAGTPALPPAAGSGRGVIGKRPADGSQQKPVLPPAAGQQRRSGAPPPAGQRSGRTGTPPSAGQRPGVIGRRPGSDEQGRHGTPPPAQRRDRRNADNQPIGPDGTPGTIGPGNTAWGTPPSTIGNTSRPTRPTSLDHDAIGGRPGGAPPRRQTHGADSGEFTRRPGSAARDAAPPVLGRERPAQPRVHGEPPPAQRRSPHRRAIDDEYGVTAQETAASVIQTPERHERDERGPAIGQAG